MKKIAVFCFVFALFAGSIAQAEKIRLEWDYPADAVIDGFKLFQTTPAKNSAGQWIEEFNYTTPLIGDISPDARFVDVDPPGEPDKVVKYIYEIRAFKGANESESSNRASYKVVNIIPTPPISLTGEYKYDESVITLSWQQPADGYDVFRWVVYYRMDTDIEFTKLGSIDQGQVLSMVKPFDVVPAGESRVVYFTVVAFRRSGVYSGNSQEFAITIDRQGPPVTPGNLKININIPVE